MRGRFRFACIVAPLSYRPGIQEGMFKFENRACRFSECVCAEIFLIVQSGASYLSQDFVVFPCELRGPAWAVGSYSISQSAGGTSQNIIFKTLQQIGRPAL